MMLGDLFRSWEISARAVSIDSKKLIRSTSNREPIELLKYSELRAALETPKREFIHYWSVTYWESRFPSFCTEDYVRVTLCVYHRYQCGPGEMFNILVSKVEHREYLDASGACSFRDFRWCCRVACELFWVGKFTEIGTRKAMILGRNRSKYHCTRLHTFLSSMSWTDWYLVRPEKALESQSFFFLNRKSICHLYCHYKAVYLDVAVYSLLVRHIGQAMYTRRDGTLHISYVPSLPSSLRHKIILKLCLNHTTRIRKLTTGIDRSLRVLLILFSGRLFESTRIRKIVVYLCNIFGSQNRLQGHFNLNRNRWHNKVSNWL